MGRSVPAVGRALDILELFLDSASLSAPDIVERLGLPRTTVHELLGTLADRSYLVPVAGQPTQYVLGLRLFQLGSIFADQLDLAHEARQEAGRVAARCDETVQVAILDGTDVVYIAKADSTHPVRLVSAVGRRLPAHCTALGKVLLSGLSDAALDARCPRDRELPGMTPRSITSPARLREHLAGVRDRGIAYDDCESNEAVHCVAAPVRDHTGAMIAALSISVPSLRWNDDRRREWADLVRDGAAALSARLGHRGAAGRTVRPNGTGPAPP